MTYRRTRRFPDISIHALLAESDFQTRGCILQSRGFLSTLSLRRATVYLARVPAAANYFYPRSPCGERPITCCPHMRHAVFLSTLSLRRATPLLRYKARGPADFYPRSPCGERLIYCHLLCTSYSNFYPRSPCGERPWAEIQHPGKILISIHALLAESDR